MINEIFVTILLVVIWDLYRRTTYCRFEPKLSIIIIQTNNGYLLLTYSMNFCIKYYDTLEQLWIHLVQHNRIYYFIDAVKSEQVIDYFMRHLDLYQVEQLFHYHVYWENKGLVRYMMKKNVLLHYPVYPNFYSLIVDEKWTCFTMVTEMMWDEFDTIFEKISPDSSRCVLELSRILRSRQILQYNPKIKKYVEDHNKKTMARIEPFMKDQRLPQDLNHLVASYLLY